MRYMHIMKMCTFQKSSQGDVSRPFIMAQVTPIRGYTWLRSILCTKLFFLNFREVHCPGDRYLCIDLDLPYKLYINKHLKVDIKFYSFKNRCPPNKHYIYPKRISWESKGAHPPNSTFSPPKKLACPFFRDCIRFPWWYHIPPHEPMTISGRWPSQQRSGRCQAGRKFWVEGSQACSAFCFVERLSDWRLVFRECLIFFWVPSH